ncbi:MAG: 30S ribosomal protein S8 [Bdellovibrionales bacterium]|nr:30S ribosomal protein S8 [Bdellovibrionales bacterium]
MDTIGDFLTRIRNAGMARHEKVDFPSSNVRQGIAQVLHTQGYIRDFKVARDGKQGVMRVYLKYTEKGEPVIKHLSRVSRPSKRIYVKATDIPKIRSGFGLAILSTNKGILSGDEATDQKVGGEFICKVW